MTGVAVKQRPAAGRWLAWLLLGGFAATAAAQVPAPKAQIFERGEYRFATGPTPDWVAVETIPAQWDEKRIASGDSRWRNWLQDTQVARYDGQRVRYSDKVYEALSSEFLTEAGKIQLPFNPEFQQLTLHEISLRRDGQWQDRLKPEAITLARRETEFERDMSLGEVTAMIVLDDLRRGDVVRLRYSVAGRNAIMAGLDGEGAVFAWSAPLLRRQLRVLFDADTAVQELRDPRVAPARVRRLGERLEWRYLAENIAPVVAEDREPAAFQRYPQVFVSERRSWGDVAEWARTLYPPPAPLPADLRERIAQWRQLPEVDARIAAALLTVQEDVRYFGLEIGDNTHRPAEPAQVWEQRRGDCKDKSRLLVAILAAMDIPANPALVSAEHGKLIADLPPSAAAFDHVIVQVPRDGGSLWLDPTSTGQRGPAAAQEISEFSFALPVKPGSAALVAVARNPASLNRTRTVERYEPQPQGDRLLLQVRAEYAGDAANGMRRVLRTQGAEALGRSYADYFRRRFSEVEMVQPLQVDDDAATNRLVLTERYRLDKPWAQETASRRALDVAADSIADAISLPETLKRQSPLALRFPSEVEHRVELVLPEGWTWDSRPEQQALDDAAASYSYRSDAEKNVIFSEERVVARAAQVEPARMGEHLSWRRSARERNAQRWVLALPADKADEARKQRLSRLLREVMDDNRKAGSEKKTNED